MTTALFESWRGRYADSPRAISERLRVRYPDVHQVWVADPTTALPAGTSRVVRHSPQYFARLLSCRFLVTNDIVSQHRVKGPRVRYLQTWHGTPLKTIGHDEAHSQYDDGAHRTRMDRDVAKWDFLLSPSPACSTMFRSAFRFGGPILETGYPRNDMLRAPDATEVRRRVRHQLGLADDAVAVLYAPTWRDDALGDDGGFEDPRALDGARFLAAGADTVLLMRMHMNVMTRFDTTAHPGRMVDASDHPEIGELYLAADVLVTDYSSAVYDFAVTGKPIVLFAYDLEHYRGGLRQLYFDYEDWAPGPIATSTDQLADAVAAITAPGGAAPWAERYAAFVERFCPHEDGGASDRAIDAVFAPILGG